MTQLLDRPPSPPPTRRRSRRPWLSANEDVRSVQVGLVMTLLIWPVLIWIFSVALRQLSDSHGGKKSFTRPKPQTSFSIDLMPEAKPEPKKEEAPLDRFVETNPDAPENKPDKTRNFAAQNQQVAQEKPTPDGRNDMPATEGKKDIESDRIVDGRMTPPELQPPPAPPPTPEVKQAQAEQQVQKEQNPLSGFEKLEGDSKTGVGFNKANPADNATAIPEKREGSKDSQLLDGAPQVTQPHIDPQRPMPRPVLDRVRARPAILADRPAGTSNVGITACDARWSEYGQYQQQFIEAVQIQWEKLLRANNINPPPGSEMSVKFRMSSDGSISEVISSQGTGGSQYEQICVSGITIRSPYGKWSEAMIAVLGDSQELTFTFYIR